MTDDLSVTPEVAQPEVTGHEAKQSSKDYNFDQLRKQKEYFEQEAYRLQQQNLALQQATSNMRKAPEEQEEAFDFRQLENEEFPEGKKLAKAFNSMDKKFKGFEQKLSEKDRKIQILETAMEYKDFAEVVTDANIEKYIKNDEDLLEAVRTASNPGKRAYNLIKKSASYQADQGNKKQVVSQEQKKVDEKESKPKTSSIGVRSESVTMAAKFSNMSKEQKQALWKEIDSYSRR